MAKYAHEIDNGYSQISTVEDALNVVRAQLHAVNTNLASNERDGFYVKADHCRVIADCLNGVIGSIERRATKAVQS